MEVEWDEQKAAINLAKHGIDFADAVGVLYDDQALTIPDECPYEERFVTVGQDFLGRLLVVVYCIRDNAFRIISARRATSHERRPYEEEQ